MEIRRGIFSEDQETPMNFEEEKPDLSIALEDEKSIWTVGGGKGGTGKSFVLANMAIYLSSKERNIILVDADLGGPNLHTMFGVKNAPYDLGNFITNNMENLEDIAIVTPYNDLKLIKGTDNVLFMENLDYSKKLGLIKKIKALNAKRIIIDIGTGTSYNSLDFFLLSDHGILIINPELTSVENAYLFLKSCIMRILKIKTEYYKVQDLRKVWEMMERDSNSIYSFLNNLMSYNSDFAQILYRDLKKFRPFLVINKSRSEKDCIIGQCMANIVQKHLAVDLTFLGTIPYDQNVHLCIKKFTPYITAYPDSETSYSIKAIAEKLIEESK